MQPVFECHNFKNSKHIFICWVNLVNTGGLTEAGSAGRQLEAGRTLAAVAAGDVDAVSVVLAQVVAAVALVDICGEQTE